MRVVVVNGKREERPAWPFASRGGGRAVAMRGVVAPSQTRSVHGEPDGHLRDALAAGNARLALQLLMDMYGPTVYRYCRRMLGADAEGEDVCQIVFIQAFEAVRRGSVIDNPRAWLRGIARHRCLDRIAGRRRDLVLVDVDELERAADRRWTRETMARDSGASEALDDCLDELDARSRMVVLLRFRDQLAYEAISELTGDRPGALRVRVARALRTLRDCLEKKGRLP